MPQWWVKVRKSATKQVFTIATRQPWVVRTARILTQPVPRQSVRSRPRSAAQVPVLARPALAPQPVRIPQCQEQRRCPVGLAQPLAPNVARGNRKEAAGENFAGVGDEDEALAVVDAGLALDGAARRPRGLRGTALLLAALRDIAPVVLRFGGLDVERRGFREVVEVAEYLLVFVRVQVVLSAARGRSRRGRRRSRGARRPRRPVRAIFGQSVQVQPGHGCVDLRFEPDARGRAPARISCGRRSRPPGGNRRARPRPDHRGSRPCGRRRTRGNARSLRRSAAASRSASPWSAAPARRCASGSSNRSGRFSGSPPVNTISGSPNSRTSSSNWIPSSVVSSRGCRQGSAEARQCRQARSQACVTSQITRKGACEKSLMF